MILYGLVAFGSLYLFVSWIAKGASFTTLYGKAIGFLTFMWGWIDQWMPVVVQTYIDNTLQFLDGPHMQNVFTVSAYFLDVFVPIDLFNMILGYLIIIMIAVWIMRTVIWMFHQFWGAD